LTFKYVPALFQGQAAAILDAASHNRGEMAMRMLLFALVFSFVAAPALAQTIAPNEAKNHVGQNVTVQGVVSQVHHAASGKVIFLDIGGRYPDAQFTAVVFASDFDKFPKVDSWEGKTVDVTGAVKLYHGRPEIILNDPAQIKAK
jgi:predicted lipoprotein